MKTIFLSLIFFLLSHNAFTNSYWENDIVRFEKLDLVSPPGEKVSLYVGSSSIRLWPELQKAFPNQNTLNRGFGGSQVSDLLFYYKRIITNYDLDRVIIYSGENDIDYGKSPEQVLKDMKELIWKIHEIKDIPIYIMSIKPSPKRSKLSEKFQKTNLLIKKAFATNRRVFFIDTFQYFFNGDNSIRSELFLSDKLHMNRAGYDIWVKKLKSLF